MRLIGPLAVDRQYQMVQLTTMDHVPVRRIPFRKIYRPERETRNYRRTVTLLIGLLDLREVTQTHTIAAVANGVLSNVYGDCHMRSLSLDIFKKDVRGNPIWLDAVGDLETARLRLDQLASVLPGEYFVFDQRSHQIVVSLVRLDSDGVRSQCSTIWGKQ